MTWSKAQDNPGGIGMLSCAVQHRNVVTTTWTDWQSCMNAGGKGFSASDGLYEFRSVATDIARNTANSALVTTTIDSTPPSITSLNVPTQTTSSFVVSWSGEDNPGGSGIAYYDAQYQIDEGAWTDWLTRTLETQGTFSGESGHVYGFRVHAVDRAGNDSGWLASVGKAGVKKYYLAGGRRVAMRVKNVVYFIHGDHLGSTSLVTNGAGEVVAQQLYMPYGEARWGSGTLPTDVGFTGQREVAQINLLFYRARFYSNSLARFVSADTIVPSAGDPQSLNRYAYTRNNPVKYVDPTGHMEADPGGGACDAECIRRMLPDFAGISWYQLSSEARAFFEKAGFSAGAWQDEQHGGVTDVAGTLQDPAVYLAAIAGGWKLVPAIGRALIPVSAKCLMDPICAAIVYQVVPKPTVQTPYGVAVQETSSEALAARGAVQNGATVYRIGKMGVSGAGEAQFWSLENPLTTPWYAAKYGMPQANFTGADFVEAGTVTQGASFVTRSAPGIGINLGQGIEVVVGPGGVRLCWFWCK